MKPHRIVLGAQVFSIFEAAIAEILAGTHTDAQVDPKFVIRFIISKRFDHFVARHDPIPAEFERMVRFIHGRNRDYCIRIVHFGGAHRINDYIEIELLQRIENIPHSASAHSRLRAGSNDCTG